MPIILNILPNVYWMYNSNSAKLENEYTIEMKKYIETYGIKTTVELDSALGFWNKSNSYINEIKKEIEKNEFGKLLAVYKKLNDVIKNGYLGNKPLLISTYKQDYLDVGLGIWIYFFHINANMSFDAVIKLLGLKIIGNITLSDNLKKFFAFLNISNG